jgi:hypothetical protein
VDKGEDFAKVFANVELGVIMGVDLHICVTTRVEGRDFLGDYDDASDIERFEGFVVSGVVDIS